jgi:hypothetical protein
VNRDLRVEYDQHEVVGACRGAAPVRLVLTADDVETLHRRIPELVRRVRQQLLSSPDGPRRDLIVDLSAVPPSSTVAPLLFLVRLLRRLVGDGKIDIIGVTPALVGALTAFELPDDVTVVDVRGRRWPG